MSLESIGWRRHGLKLLLNTGKLTKTFYPGFCLYRYFHVRICLTVAFLVGLQYGIFEYFIIIIIRLILYFLGVAWILFFHYDFAFKFVYSKITPFILGNFEFGRRHSLAFLVLEFVLSPVNFHLLLWHVQFSIKKCDLWFMFGVDFSTFFNFTIK